MENLEDRLRDVEWKTSNLSSDLNSLRHSLHAVETGLQAVTTHLNQIKWIGIGAVLSFLVGELGVLESLRLLIGS